MVTVVAHQGGWDEILLVAGPVVVFAVLLLVAKRRAEQEAAAEAQEADADRPADPDAAEPI